MKSTQRCERLAAWLCPPCAPRRAGTSVGAQSTRQRAPRPGGCGKLARPQLPAASRKLADLTLQGPHPSARLAQADASSGSNGPAPLGPLRAQQVEPLAPPEGAPVGERCWFGEEAEQGEPAKPNQVRSAPALGYVGRRDTSGP